MSIYYTYKNIRQQYKNNKLKIIAPTCNDEFELPDGSYLLLDIQYNIKYAIKKTFPANPPVHIYINTINNRLVLKTKDGYNLELQTPETLKFVSTKKINRQNK